MSSAEMAVVLCNALPADLCAMVLLRLRTGAAHAIQTAFRRHMHFRLNRLPRLERDGFRPVGRGPLHGCYTYNGRSSPAGRLMPGRLRHDLMTWCRSLPTGEYALLVRVVNVHGHAKAAPTRKMSHSRERSAKWAWLARDALGVAFQSEVSPLRVDLHVWVRK